jgi:arsenical pump membrane protein
VLLGAGAAALAIAAMLSRARTTESAGHVWEPFVLVAGLLLVGLVAHGDGVFEAIAARLARTPGGPGHLLVVLLLLTAAVTAVLNLDTSVAFLTPILVLTARRRGAPEAPFVYGAVLMSNSASLLLPGSNLTNLLVLHRENPSGAAFAARMGPAWVVAVACTIAFLLIRYRRALAHPAAFPRGSGPVVSTAPVRRLGVVATAIAALVVVFLRAPALPVLALGIVVVAVRRYRQDEIIDAVNPATLFGLYGICVALGALATVWTGPGRLVATASPLAAATIGALAAVALNNLPAAVLLGTGAVASPDALLLGLNLGPNLAVTGSLSAVLWLQSARRTGSQPSLRTFSRLGIILVPLSIAACLACLAVWPVRRF